MIKAIRLYRKAKPILKWFEEQDVAKIFTNWKTTLAAIVIVVGMAGPSLGLTEKQSAAISSLAAAFGLATAKDFNVTGGTRQQ